MTTYILIKKKNYEFTCNDYYLSVTLRLNIVFKFFSSLSASHEIKMVLCCEHAQHHLAFRPLITLHKLCSNELQMNYMSITLHKNCARIKILVIMSGRTVVHYRPIAKNNFSEMNNRLLPFPIGNRCWVFLSVWKGFALSAILEQVVLQALHLRVCPNIQQHLTLRS